MMYFSCRKPHHSC